MRMAIPRSALLPAVLAALVAVFGCSRQTDSVHLPLAVGNRWVYDVVSDSIHDTAVLEVIGEDGGVFTVSAACTTGHWSRPRTGTLLVQCLDSVLMVRDTALVRSRSGWRELLSDDPSVVRTQTLLLCRTWDRNPLDVRCIGTAVVNGDSYDDCLQLHSRYTDSWWAIIAGGTDSIEAEEVYCPEVGLVSFSREDHWSGWVLFPSGGTSSGVSYDTWRLRDYRLADR